MQAFRRFFVAWIFALISALLIVAVVFSSTKGFNIQGRPQLHRAIVPVAAVLAIAAVFGMAWWTTWMKKPLERTWGAAASLLCLLALATSMHFFHHHLDNSRYTAIVFSVGALITYLWPDGPKESAPEGMQGKDYIDP